MVVNTHFIAKMSRLLWYYLFGVLAILSAVRGQTAGQTVGQAVTPPRIVLSHGGAVIGTTLNSARNRPIDAFFSIPYAEPPVGPLRFKSPVPKEGWKGEIDAQTSPNYCPQIDIFSMDKVPLGDEDCLYLNVYVPKGTQTNNLPVMVWIHGGGYHMGSSDPVLYGPERLLDSDVILVTFNYRLGVLGFLSTGTEESPGNYGLKDQNLVLQWIHQNINAFGGNPHDVTLFGTSSGAASIGYHMISEKSKGLFHKAIMQSGNPFDPWAFVDQERSMERLKKLAAEVGCPLRNINYLRMITCLRKVRVDDMVSTINTFYLNGTYFPITVFGPVIEPNVTDAFMIEDPREVMEYHGIGIPLIIGVTADEGVGRSGPILHQFDDHFKKNYYSLLPILLEYDHRPKHVQERITERIDQYYFKSVHDWTKGNHQRLTDMFTDRNHFFGMDQYLRNRFSTLMRPVGKTYMYVFGHRGPHSTSELIGSGPDYYGVSHGDEIPYLFPFGQMDVMGTKADQLMKWALPKMWTDFAWTGDPTPQGSNIREEWRSALKYPLKYVQIGHKTMKENYRHTRVGYARSRNFTFDEQEDEAYYIGNLDDFDLRLFFDSDYGVIPNEPRTHTVQTEDDIQQIASPPSAHMVPREERPRKNLQMARKHKLRKHKNKKQTKNKKQKTRNKKQKKGKHGKKQKRHKATRMGKKGTHYHVMKTRQGMVPRRMSFWRGMERMLYNR